jgi:hypothetical protein
VHRRSCFRDLRQSIGVRGPQSLVFLVRGVLTRKSSWATAGFMAAACALAFLGPYKLPAFLKGLVAVASVLVTAAQARYVSRQDSSSEERTSKKARKVARTRFLEAVRDDWVSVFLEPELLFPEAEPTLAWVLHGDEQGNVVESGLNAPPGSSVAELLCGNSRQLLILGAGGSGKTTVLTQAADELARSAADDPSTLLPTPLPLSAWYPSGVDFLSWVTSEVARRYRIPAGVTRRWAADGALALLLDGLDELPDDLGVQVLREIDAFLDGYGLNSILVTCRSEEYERIENRSPLRFRRVLMIEPLARVSDGLVTSTHPAKLHDVLKAAANLPELFETPLMYYVASIAFDRLSPAELLATPAEDRRSLLFDEYVAEMLRRPRRRPLPSGEPNRARRWLSWLAASGGPFRPHDLGSDWLRAGHERRLLTVGMPIAGGVISAVAASFFIPLGFSLLVGFGCSLVLMPDRTSDRPLGKAFLDRDVGVAVTATLMAAGFVIVASLVVNTLWLAVMLAATAAARLVLRDYVTRIMDIEWTRRRMRSPLEARNPVYFYNQVLPAVAVGVGIAASLSAQLVSSLPLQALIVTSAYFFAPPLLAAFGLLGTPLSPRGKRLERGVGISLWLALTAARGHYRARDAQQHRTSRTASGGVACRVPHGETL